MRLFIGIAIPEDIRRQIHETASIMEAAAPGKYVREDMYHVTLAYIGECDDEMYRKTLECMRKCAAASAITQLLTGDTGYFGKPEKGILHIGFTETDGLHEIAGRLRMLLSEAGLPFDPKPMVPHITLARNVKITDTLLSIKYSETIISVTGLTLFNSCRVDDILQYIPVEYCSFE